MKLYSNSWNDGQMIPGDFAFCIADPERHVALGPNRNPHRAWDDVSAATLSFALICHDLPRLPVKDKPTGQLVRAALVGHILAQASLNGPYTVNPSLTI